MPTLVLLLPLSLLPAALAQPLWLASVFWGWIWTVVGLSYTLNPLGRPSTRAVMVIWSLLLYPVAWGLLLGQPALAAAALLTAALIALRNERDTLAGIALAAAAIKPQITLLAILALLVWAAWQRRHRLIASFAISVAILLAISFALLPSWVAGFLYAVQRYADLMPFRSPISALAALFGGSGRWIQIALAIGLTILTGWSWRKDARAGAVPIRAVSLSLVVTTLVIPRLSPINHVVLLIPLASGLSAWWGRKGMWRLASAALGALSVAAPWAIDPLTGSTTGGSPWQYAALVSVLPLAGLLVVAVELVRQHSPSSRMTGRDDDPQE
jgi:hypothetical protein